MTRQGQTLIERHAVMVIVMVALGVMVGAMSSVLAIPRYSSTAAIMITPNYSREGTDLGQLGSMIQGRMSTYYALATSGSVLGPVVESLPESETIGQLSARVEVAMPVNSSIIRITARDTSAEGSAEVANGIAASLEERIREESAVPGSGVSALEVVTIQDARDALAEQRPSLMLSMAIGGLAGLAASAVAAYLLDAFWPERRSPRRLRKAAVEGEE